MRDPVEPCPGRHRVEVPAGDPALRYGGEAQDRIGRRVVGERHRLGLHHPQASPASSASRANCRPITALRTTRALTCRV